MPPIRQEPQWQDTPERIVDAAIVREERKCVDDERRGDVVANLTVAGVLATMLAARHQRGGRDRCERRDKHAARPPKRALLQRSSTVSAPWLCFSTRGPCLSSEALPLRQAYEAVAKFCAANDSYAARARLMNLVCQCALNTYIANFADIVLLLRC